MQQTRYNLLFVIAGLAWAGAPAMAAEVPAWLPQYDLDVKLDVQQRLVTVHEKVTWTNRHSLPACELVMNVFPRYKIPKEDVVILAKTLELLRTAPSDAMDKGRRLEIQRIHLGGEDLAFYYREDNQTALVIPLPKPVEPGQSVAIELDFTLELPEKQGRFGQWKGTTFLANWHPILAYYDDKGWQPTPYIPWHQPFFSEAGVYNVNVTLPADQKIASSGTIAREEEIGDGLKLVHIPGCIARDFSLVCSNRFQEHTAQAGNTKVRVLAYPEHECMAQRALTTACEVIPLYNRWFGDYPFDELDIVESHFPWNGNECSGMVMLDERVFSLPKMVELYVDHLVSHEVMHQWWFNVIGTNGYCETWMDEGVVSFYTAKRYTHKYGKNAPLIKPPKGFEWMPNIHYDDYRFYGMYGTLARGEATKMIQPIPDFKNVVTLFSMTYDRGGKVLGMIEDRVGETAMFDFMRLLYGKYQFQILRVADFQCELEAYTGRSWEDFFQKWFYGVGMTDWAVENVRSEESVPRVAGPSEALPNDPDCEGPATRGQRYVVTLRQKGEFCEPTVLGVKFDPKCPYELRIPVHQGIEINESEDVPAHVRTCPDGSVQVEMTLARPPVQISVDPDQVLLDCEPANNHWKPEVHYEFTLQTDITTPYDRWSVIAGPWGDEHGYWGVHAGVFRMQQFKAGVFLGYHQDDESLGAGGDFLIDHWPWPRTQVGFFFVHGLTPDWEEARKNQAKLFGRYVRYYTASLYLPPMEYVEIYARLQDEFWRRDGPPPPGIERYDDLTAVGIHFHRDYLTPYWDPEGGYRLDLNYENGLHVLGADHSYNRAEGEFSIVQGLPEGLGYLSQTRVAARVMAGVGGPDNGQHFQLGGQSRIRGLERDDRQGSLFWIGSLEWRLPIWREVNCEVCDNVARLRHLYGAVFYDVGAMYLNGDSVEGVAHSLGAGLRFDVAWFSFIERTTFRIDVAKVVNGDEPVQIWLGFKHAF